MIKHLVIAVMGLSLVLGGFNISFAKGNKKDSRSAKGGSSGSDESTKENPALPPVEEGDGDSSGTTCGCGGGSGGGYGEEGPAPDYENGGPATPLDPQPPGAAPVSDGSDSSDSVSGCGTSRGSAPDSESAPAISCEETAFSKYRRCLDNGGERRICKKKLLYAVSHCE